MLRVRPLLALLLLAAGPLAGQLAPPSTGGLPALEHALTRLGHYQRVLMIAAHPDDEDTELLTVLVRGYGAEAAYLSLNRGEGGQNLIGPELGEELGLLRSQELLAARQLDGARQFFTRAFDFGYSKTLDDTWAHWPRDSVLKDVVRIVRRFRPQVVVSIFSGTPRDGHGQHQAAGWAAQEAFAIAGDATRFPELQAEEGLAPWTPLLLYRSARFDTAATTLTLDGGEVDPAVGQSFHQIAMRGRSLHRSQDMGQLQRGGPSAVRLARLTDRTSGGPGLFGGLDTTLAGVPVVQALPPEPRRKVAAALEDYAVLVDSARGLLAPGRRTELARTLDRARAVLERARGLILDRGGPARRLRADPVLQGDPFEGELARLARAQRLAAGVVADGVAEATRVVPGGRVRVAASLWNTGTEARAVELCLGSARQRWELVSGGGRESLGLSPRRGTCLGVGAGASGLVAAPGPGVALPPGAQASATVDALVPEAADYTSPYFLRAPRQGDLYTWDPDDRSVWGEPFGPPEFWVEATPPDEAGVDRDRVEIAFRDNDQGSGEFRLPVVVVPRVDVRLEPEHDLWPAGNHAHEFTVTLTHGGPDTVSGTVALRLPAGWPQPKAQPFRFTAPDEHRSYRFVVRPPGGVRPGAYPVSALATDARGRVYDVGVRTIAHSHVYPRTYARRAAATVQVATLVLPRLSRIAYLRGAADHVPEALQSVGLPVEVIAGADLSRITPERWPVLVIGPRAYETDSALVANNAALLAYARAGGTVIVQYQQYAYFLGGFAPFPLTVGTRRPGSTVTATTGPTSADSARPAATALLGGHDRVTDETAPVRLVDPAAAVLRSPNRIGAGDWDGWVQERGLYFAHSWGREWHPVLEMHDPGEDPLQGSLLLTQVGRGTYVYTGLSFFRQLPAAVPGAFRLFANLLALGERRPAAAPPARRDSLPSVERE